MIWAKLLYPKLRSLPRRLYYIDETEDLSRNVEVFFFMKFMRVGGLSAVNHKKFYKANNDEEYKQSSFTGGMHVPPKKKGIYAFPFPYMEMFLVLWSERHEKELETRGVTKFEFDGDIWHHLDVHNPKNILDERGYWVKTTITVYEDSLRRDIHRLNKESHKDKFTEGRGMLVSDDPMTDNPYKRGRCGFYSRDHLEVFIDKSSIARIR